MTRVVLFKHTSQTETLAFRPAEAELRQILKSAPQHLWLDTIRRASFAEHDALIFWMLSQVQCDFAVAVNAFFRSNPARHLENPQPLPLQPEPQDHFALILLNWDKGYYREHTLEIGEVDRPARALAHLNQKMIAWPRGSLPYRVPRQLLAQEGGRPINVPRHMSPDTNHDMWHLYSNLGLRVTGKPPNPGCIGMKTKRLRAKLRLGRSKNAR